KQAAAALEKAYADAPKRDAAEPIRIVVVANTEASGLAPLMGAYAQMLEQALAATPRLQIVPASQVGLFLSGTTGDGMDKKKIGDVAVVDEKLTRVLRDLSGAADVVVVLHASEKSKSGFVSGKGGAGVVEMVN